ncbi:hypothetical protein [Nocardia sp. NBC_01388]|uniref:hypothetical protein n=1 Tax=Nocardia sp. NBC_01388 TaxID=2903596 RepID=UPI003251F9BC
MTNSGNIIDVTRPARRHGRHHGEEYGGTGDNRIDDRHCVEHCASGTVTTSAESGVSGHPPG